MGASTIQAASFTVGDPRHRAPSTSTVGGPNMASIARKSDGRRIFTEEFKRKQIDRVWRGELTIAELSRKHGIAPSLLQRWKRLVPRDAQSTRAAPGRATSANDVDSARYVRELQLMVGKLTVELELVRAERDALMLQRRTRPVNRR
jgi:transposase